MDWARINLLLEVANKAKAWPELDQLVALAISEIRAILAEAENEPQLALDGGGNV